MHNLFYQNIAGRKAHKNNAIRKGPILSDIYFTSQKQTPVFALPKKHN